MNPPNPRLDSGRRFAVFAVCVALAAAGLVARYAYLMLGPSASLSRPPRAEAASGRGAILDRNGRILAMETRLGNVTLWRPEMKDPIALAAELAPLLGMTSRDIRDRISASKSDFIYIKKQVDDATLKLVEAAIADGGLEGVGIEPLVGRVYPEGTLASQIVGFVGDENIGLGGVEYAFEQDLAPTPSGPGSQVFLTIDVNVQYILESIGARVFQESQPEALMFMAMDPRSGDVLGSVSLPGFDPNDFKNSSDNARMDRPAIWAYEPGSVFKVFSIAALMDSGAISGASTFHCDGHYERVTNRGERVVINCLGAHGDVTPRDIIIYSCNAGAAYAADRIPASPFYDRLRDFGFGARTGAGAPGETAGFLRPAERWSDRSKPTISMGQEIAVSAMQMLQAASAVANDGLLTPPRVVSRVVSPAGESRPYSPGESRRVLLPETAQAMRGYMQAVTSDIGTGWRANVEDLSLAVKTGTAQIIDPATGAYSDTGFIASCLALLPAESPTLVLYLAIVKPQGDYLGGRIAAPPIREAAERLIDYLGIPRGKNQQITHPGSIAIPAPAYAELGDTMPDLTGLAKRQLLPLLLQGERRFDITGEGWVVRQSPLPGAPLAPDTPIVLEFE